MGRTKNFFRVLRTTRIGPSSLFCWSMLEHGIVWWLRIRGSSLMGLAPVFYQGSGWIMLIGWKDKDIHLILTSSCSENHIIAIKKGKRCLVNRTLEHIKTTKQTILVAIHSWLMRRQVFKVKTSVVGEKINFPSFSNQRLKLRWVNPMALAPSLNWWNSCISNSNKLQ